MSQQEAYIKKILNTQNYYSMLECQKDATLKELSEAYKRIALQIHPDKNSSPKSTEAFKKLAKAFSTLKNNDKRNQYDSLLLNSFQSESSNEINCVLERTRSQTKYLKILSIVIFFYLICNNLGLNVTIIFGIILYLVFMI